MRKQFKKVALGVACAMAISVTAPVAQTSYAGTTVYEVTLGTPERRGITEETLKVGETIDLNFYGVKDWNKNKANYKCKWTASGDAVTVSNWGVVTAVKGGTAVINLTITDKITGVSHNIAPTTITVIAEPEPTATPTQPTVDGLKTYTLNADGTAYSVCLSAEAAWENVVIPEEYNGLPVTEVTFDGFEGGYYMNLVLPKTVTKLGEGDFSGACVVFKGTEEEWNAVSRDTEMWLTVICMSEMVNPEDIEWEYTLNEGGTSYSLTGPNRYGNTEEEDDEEEEQENSWKCIVVSEEYNGLPVTEIAEGMFASGFPDTIFLPNTITKIGSNAFTYCWHYEIYVIYEGTEEEYNAIEKERWWMNAENAFIIYLEE